MGTARSPGPQRWRSRLTETPSLFALAAHVPSQSPRTARPPLLQEFYPNSIDSLEREKALFPGPDPILLAGIEHTDLTYLLCGSDRSDTSQVEFGANQVILVRTMAAYDDLPVSLGFSLEEGVRSHATCVLGAARPAAGR